MNILIHTKKISINLDSFYLSILVLSVFSIPFFRIELNFIGARYLLSLPIIIIFAYFYLKIIEIVTTGKKLSFQIYPNFLMIGFLLWSVMSLLWSEYPQWSFWLELTFYIAFFLFTINFCKLKQSALLKIHQLLFYVAFLLVLVGLFRFFTRRSPWFEFVNHYETGFGTRNSDIFMIVTILPIAFSSLLFFYRKNIEKVVIFIITFLFSIAILLSFSRGQLITSILLLSILSVFYINLMRVRYIALIGTITLVFFLVAGFLFILMNYYSGTYEFLVERFNTISESERIPIAIFAFNVAMEHPLLGIGLDNLKYIIPQKVDAHNAYLNVLGELGIVGFLFFCLILFYPAYRYIKLFRRIKLSTNYVDKGIYIQGFGLIIALIISSIFHTFYNFIYFWIIYTLSYCNLIYLNLTKRE